MFVEEVWCSICIPVYPQCVQDRFIPHGSPFLSVTFLCTEETAFEAGVRVQIHSQAEPPFVHELGFGVAPGFQTFVATQEQRVSNDKSCSLSSLRINWLSLL